jgi:hypothetical protein
MLCISAFGVMSTFADMMNVEAKKISPAYEQIAKKQVVATGH